MSREIIGDIKGKIISDLVNLNIHMYVIYSETLPLEFVLICYPSIHTNKEKIN